MQIGWVQGGFESCDLISPPFQVIRKVWSVHETREVGAHAGDEGTAAELGKGMSSLGQNQGETIRETILIELLPEISCWRKIGAE